MGITIKGFKIGQLEVVVEGSEGHTLKEVLTAAGVKQDGQQFIINGDRKAPVTDTAKATVRSGDTVEVYDRPQAGICPVIGG